jgi:release factor glutamine methyltransferase
MFVQTNSVQSIREYFKSRLENRFSDNEIKIIGNEVICQRLGLSPADLIGINDQLLSESDLLFFRSIVKRLLNNEPFQYIVGNAHFYGLELLSDKRALIPRPETEELVDWIRESYLNKNEILSIADICTGSGCIALAVKSLFPNAKITATDISSEALQLAKENAIKTDFEIDFKQFSALDEVEYNQKGNFQLESFDCWVSNPPYIPEEDKKQMAENVLDFEPHLALFVPDTKALIFYEKIAEMAKRYLKSKGLLFFEIHENLGQETKSLLEDLGFEEVEIRNDLQGKNRMIKAVKK